MVAITGIPGIGKTEVAIQYGRSHWDEYLGGVAWFAAAEFGEAVRDWMQGTFCPDRDLRHLSALEQQVAQGWKEWQDYCGVERLALVIIDDVTDYRQQIAPYLPKVESDRFPFRFLLTGRSHLGSQIPTLELTELNSDAAVTVLARFAGPERITTDRTTAETLCTRLGYLPLAIALAGCWLSIDADRTLTDLIECLEKHGLDAPVLKHDPNNAKLAAERGVQATFAVSWEQLAKINPSSQQLARVLSLFAAADLPWELVTAVVQWYTQSYAQPQPEPQRRSRPRQWNWFQRVWRWLCALFGYHSRPTPLTRPISAPITDLIEAKGALLRLSLMQRVDENGHIYRLHPLLREFFAEQWQGADRQGWEVAFSSVVSIRARGIPADLSWEQAMTFDKLRPHLEPAFQLLQNRVVTTPDTQTAKRYKELSSDINAAVFRLSRPPLFEATFAQACKLHDQAKAAAARGRTQQASQKFTDALEDYRKAITRAREAFPADSMQLAGYLHQLANLFDDLGSYHDGIPPAEEAVNIARTKASTLKLAAYLDNLAGLYKSLGHYKEAEPLLVRSLQIKEQQLGVNYPDTATTLNGLAELYRLQWRYKQAEPLYLSALHIVRNRLKKAIILNNLGLFYIEQGRYSEAEPLLLQAIEIDWQVLGAEHSGLATDLHNLALLHSSQGQHFKAEPLFLRALQIKQRTLSKNHPLIADTLYCLGRMYVAQDKFSQAEFFSKQALEIDLALFGENHARIAEDLNSLAWLYESQGRYEEAESFYVRSLQIKEQQLGADHPDTATSLNSLAWLYSSQERYEEAEPLLVRSLQIKEQQLGADHPDTAISLRNLAGLYRVQGRYGEAEPLYVQSLQTDQQVYGVDHPEVATDLNNLAGLYYAQGRYEEAEPLLVRTLEIRIKVLGENHPNTQTAWNNFRYLMQQVVEAGRAGELSEHPITQAVLQQLKGQ